MVRDTPANCLNGSQLHFSENKATRLIKRVRRAASFLAVLYCSYSSQVLCVQQFVLRNCLRAGIKEKATLHLKKHDGPFAIKGESF